MKQHLDDVEGFCARTKDVFYNSTYWRGKDKTKAQAKKDTAKHKL